MPASKIKFDLATSVHNLSYGKKYVKKIKTDEIKIMDNNHHNKKNLSINAKVSEQKRKKISHRFKIS